jgi:hypothetical protein
MGQEGLLLLGRLRFILFMAFTMAFSDGVDMRLKGLVLPDQELKVYGEVIAHLLQVCAVVGLRVLGVLQ